MLLYAMKSTLLDGARRSKVLMTTVLIFVPLRLELLYLFLFLCCDGHRCVAMGIAVSQCNHDEVAH